MAKRWTLSACNRLAYPSNLWRVLRELEISGKYQLRYFGNQCIAACKLPLVITAKLSDITGCCKMVRGTQKRNTRSRRTRQRWMNLFSFPGQPFEDFQGIKNLGEITVKILQESMHRRLQASASNNRWCNWVIIARWLKTHKNETREAFVRSCV